MWSRISAVMRCVLKPGACPVTSTAPHREIGPGLIVEPVVSYHQRRQEHVNAEPSGSLRDQVPGSGRDTQVLRGAVRLDVSRRGDARLQLRGQRGGGGDIRFSMPPLTAWFDGRK